MANKPKILIVDDDEQIRRLLKIVLCEQHDSIFECESVDTFEGCMAICKDGLPDLVILDLGLSDREGFDGLRELHERFPKLGIVVFTGNHGGKNATRAIHEFGALAYITKPVDVDDLYKAISDALIRSRAARQMDFNALFIKITAVIGALTTLAFIIKNIIELVR